MTGPSPSNTFFKGLSGDFGDIMKVKYLLYNCEDAYDEEDFERLLKLSGDVLKIDEENPIAISYKSVSYCFLNQPEKALEILKKASAIHPRNYYHKNIAAMAYYDLGEYEKSLECCEEGLEIRKFDWLVENKIKALIRLGRADEAIEIYEDSRGMPNADIAELLIEGGEYRLGLDYDSDDDSSTSHCRLIDEIKDSIHGKGLEVPDEIGDFYKKWIYRIKSMHDTKTCPDCGGRLAEIVYGYPNPKILERSVHGDVVLGGCSPMPYDWRCRQCGHDFAFGHNGLEIDCEDEELYDYIIYKIDEITYGLKRDSMIFDRFTEGLKKEVLGFDDEEFDAFITHLAQIGYVRFPHEECVRIEGFDYLSVMKEYCDEGRFHAPRWLVYPQYSFSSIYWRMGPGENYAMNSLTHSNEFEELFPAPSCWRYGLSHFSRNPTPPLAFFWREDGKPKYPETTEGLDVGGFITPNDEGKFTCDSFTFTSIEDAVDLSRRAFFERYSDEDLDRIWRECEYSVLLNACYFKVMEDDELKKKLLETGDEPLIYDSDDGENLFSRALMELRDEIRRICTNEDLIDWEYTEYLKQIPWM